jgi:hypothetical protein
VADASNAPTAGGTDCRDDQADTGRELRVGFSETNLVHFELSCTGDDPLIEKAEDLRLVLMGAGWIKLRASSTTQ